MFHACAHQANEEAVTFSLKTLNKAKCVVLAAAGKSRAPMVLEALRDGSKSPMPVAKVSASQTKWLVDYESVALFRDKYGFNQAR